MSFNFIAAVTICSDFGAQKIKSVTVSVVSSSICREAMGLDVMIFFFFFFECFRGALVSCSKGLTFPFRLACTLQFFHILLSAHLYFNYDGYLFNTLDN